MVVYSDLFLRVFSILGVVQQLYPTATEKLIRRFIENCLKYAYLRIKE